MPEPVTQRPASSSRPDRPRLELYAVQPEGAIPLALPPGGSGIHDVLDDLPLGIYEAFRSRGGQRILRLERHLDRADRSLELLNWKQRVDRAAVRQAVHEVLEHWAPLETRIRLDLLEGPARKLGTTANTLLVVEKVTPPRAEILTQGVAVDVARDLHRDTPRIKRARWVLERRRADSSSYEHLLVDEDGLILECTSSNFFAVRDGALWTASRGMLEGITRDVILEVARELAIEVHDQAIPLSEVDSLDEAFLTSSSRGPVPIVEIDGRRIGRGLPGSLFARILAAFHELVEREARPPLAP